MIRLAAQQSRDSGESNNEAGVTFVERGGDSGPGARGDGKKAVAFEPVLYSQRWVQLAILAFLALIR